MEYTVLNNGIKMPMAGIGTFLMTPDEAEASVLSALSVGYRLIDTASSYQNEEAVGRALRRCGVPREDLFITTKAYIQQMGYEKTKEAFEESLEKLGLEYLDPGEHWKNFIKRDGYALSVSAIFSRTACWICVITWRSDRRLIRLSGIRTISGKKIWKS